MLLGSTICFFLSSFFNEQNIFHEPVGVPLIQTLHVHQDLLKSLQQHSPTLPEEAALHIRAQLNHDTEQHSSNPRALPQGCAYGQTLLKATAELLPANTQLLHARHTPRSAFSAVLCTMFNSFSFTHSPTLLVRRPHTTLLFVTTAVLHKERHVALCSVWEPKHSC